MIEPTLYYLEDDGTTPNSYLPILHYPEVIKLPFLSPSKLVKTLFSKHGWTNNATIRIFTFHHYHSVTHKCVGVISGHTTLLLGGENGVRVHVKKGDVIVIPAGVACRNLGKVNAVSCVEGFPGGMNFDLNYSKIRERLRAEKDIAALPLPVTDPVYVADGPLIKLWEKNAQKYKKSPA